METTVLILFGLATIHVCVAQNRGVIDTEFNDDQMNDIDLAIYDEFVKLTCEIQCDVGETVYLIGPNRVKISFGECRLAHGGGSTIADMDSYLMNKSLAFGEYKCKYKDRVIEESASSWDYHYRTCSKAEGQGVSEPNTKGLFVVDRNDPSCHAVRTCGDRQHIEDYLVPGLVCPANERSICHAAAKNKYDMALMSQQFVKSCTEKPVWYISYGGVPIRLNSLVQLRKGINKFKVHCPTATDGKRLYDTVDCYIDKHTSKVERGSCTEAADLLIPDAVFAGSGGKRLRCLSTGEVYATLIYADPDQNMTCTESKDESINCVFKPALWRKFDVKKSIKCSSTERKDKWPTHGNFIIAPDPNQCEEYSIVAEVSYVHPGTHEVFKMPLFESGPFRKKPKQTECNVTTNAMASGSQTTASSAIDGKACPTNIPCSKCNTSRQVVGDADNSADLFDPGSWYIGISMWSVVQAMMR